MLDVGLRLALPNARTVCYVEIEAFPCEVLVSRMEDKALDEAPVWTDLKTFDGKPWRGSVDIVIGGYPCQPFSIAGRRKGADDPRHLWPYIFRIITEVRPRFCFFENVEGHIELGFLEVKESLESVGYAVEAGIFSAAEVGAPHGRRRLYILAYNAKSGLEGRVWEKPQGARVGSSNGKPAMAHSRRGSDQRWQRSGELAGETSKDQGGEGNWTQPEMETERRRGELGYYYYSRLEGRSLSRCGCASQLPAWPPSPSDTAGWGETLRQDKTVEPAICRVVDGVDTRMDSSVYAYRIDRLRAVGNGVVPITAATAFAVLYRKLVKE